jgi:antitoxin component YwqK of YwqJK toxin-antitoxin module
MRVLILLLAILIISAAGAQVSSLELYKKKDVFYLDSTRYTGPVINKDENGRIVFSGQLKNGLKQDTWIVFEDGDTVSIENYNLGKKDGEWKVFHENNQVNHRGFYSENKMDGTWSFYDTQGKLTKTIVYENGKYQQENYTSDYSYKKISIGFQTNLQHQMWGGFAMYRINPKHAITGSIDFYGKREGTERALLNTQGSYTEGQNGSVSTGLTDQILFTEGQRFQLGYAYRLLSRWESSVYLHAGVGFNNFKETAISYAEVQPQTGDNFWYVTSLEEQKAPGWNASIGVMYHLDFFFVGVGYDFQPNGVNMRVGFNF